MLIHQHTIHTYITRSADHTLCAVHHVGVVWGYISEVELCILTQVLSPQDVDVYTFTHKPVTSYQPVETQTGSRTEYGDRDWVPPPAAQ